MELIDGKKLSATLKEEIAREVEEIKQGGGKTPHLVAVLVGNDPASETYVNNKEKACNKVGIESEVIRLEESISQEELLKKVDELNNDPEVDGFIVQLPLPEHIDDQKVIEAVDPKKDVDGFHPVNMGRMVLGLPSYLPATPAGILEMLKRYDIETEGKDCVVLGRSNIVGKPVANLMLQKATPGNCTVTICHSRTKNLNQVLAKADILIVAMGKMEFVTADMVKEGAVVIDVGIHRIKSDKTKSGWKLKGDVKFEEVKEKASYITPVPGGVGPMTIVSLLRNTIAASQGRIYG
ncbi:MAG: bifunctional methylenetetrahydrofolate dehydrogenase/methenyltetrahydrofolate cyclohydrolase FolD [Bacteroidales bacterium]|nr:bifunctional methylenetetrahydrofolate dehydrogenase/methenyltetrahydrofolate cyclohydrolase FolD [Bacteroidales bacterium]MBS3774531.1 bifunctional methylenetetrahydrofolate dehydrogenase/methenyltetrahydrofolate cyclohydrolase FolD [Bacteroidales bacterium]